MNTKLMTKLFSSDGNEELKAAVNQKLDEAKEKGSASLEMDDEQLEFASVGDSIIIEDKTNGEITEATVSDDDVDMTAIKCESETQPDVTTPVTPGKDGAHAEGTQPDASVDNTEGISNREKAGHKTFSLKFSSKSKPDYIASVVRSFSEAGLEPDVEIVEEVDEEPVAKSPEAVRENQEPEISEEKKAKVEDVTKRATKLKSDATQLMDSKDVELAKQVKADADQLICDCDEIEDVADTTEVKAYSRIFSEVAEKVIKDAEKDPKDNEESKDDSKKDDDKDKPAPTKEEKDDVKESANRTFSVTSQLIDNIAAPSPAYVRQESRQFSNTDVPKTRPASVNPYLTTPM